jgi:hypothetical protein
VLVAGGLGERLGYSGIKIALPCETASQVSADPETGPREPRAFLALYAQHILALQAASGAGAPLPLAIMTSDDTHARTAALLADNGDFGLAPGQVTLMKQEKVAALADNEARLAVEDGDPFAVQAKPHGHGDVHMVMHSSGTAKRWLKAGVEHVFFFQDTNGACAVLSFFLFLAGPLVSLRSLPRSPRLPHPPSVPRGVRRPQPGGQLDGRAAAAEAGHRWDCKADARRRGPRDDAVRRVQPARPAAAGDGVAGRGRGRPRHGLLPVRGRGRFCT